MVVHLRVACVDALGYWSLQRRAQNMPDELAVEVGIRMGIPYAQGLSRPASVYL